MPVEVLRPGFVEDAEDAGIFNFTGAPSSAAFVGSQSVLWRDDDPDTYADLTSTFTTDGSTITHTREDEAVAPLDQLSVGSTTATLNSIRIEWTASNLTTDVPTTVSPTAQFSLLDATSYDVFYGYMAQWDGLGFINNLNPSPQDTTFLTGEWSSSFRHPDTGINFTASEVLDFLASGDVMVAASVVNSSLATVGSFTNTARIQDIKITVDYDLITRPVTPRRLWPAVDNGGTGPTRLWPPRSPRLWPPVH